MQRLLAVCLLAGAPLAQVPFDYFLVAEQVSGTAPALRYVQPKTGVVTVVSVPNAGPTRFLDAARLDPADPNTIYLAKNAPRGTSAQITAAAVQGARITSQPAVNPGISDVVKVIEIFNGVMYLVVPTGANSGLYTYTLGGGGTALKIDTTPNIADLEVLGGKVYAMTYQSGVPSTLLEYDPASNTTNIIGSNYPAAQSLGHFTGMLVAGADNGDIYGIDVTSGTSATLFTPGKGAVVAIASRESAPLFTFATSKEVYEFGNFATPLYTAQGTIHDLVQGIHDQATFLEFGIGCVGSNGRPSVSANGLPSIGNAGFTVGVSNAAASQMGTIIVGASRQQASGLPLPQSLNSIGMTGCFLYSDILVQLPVPIDASGQGSFGIPIPNLQWKGGHFTGQFFIRDPGANSFGLVASSGFEGIVR